MAGSTQESSVATADIFDKYVLPKAALAIILTASLVGTAVTVRLTGHWAVAVTVVKWGYFVALGVLAGGLLWKHGFVRPGDLDTEAAAYCGRMYDRFDRVAAAALGVLVPGATVVLHQYESTLARPLLPGAPAATLAALAVVVGVGVARSATADAQFRRPLGVAALALAVTAVALTATAEVALRAGTTIDAAVRVLHLLAFAAWVGGAVWNIFVAVPSGQQHPSVSVIRAAGQQLERFRWAVRIIIPALLATGVYQAVDVFGYRADAYLHTLVGRAVLAKLGFVGVLVAIFKLCPMWRACSPIDGVCDITDLDGNSGSTESTADTGGSDD